MSRKSSTNRSGTSKPSANADSSPSRTMASGTTRLIAWPSTGTKPRRAVNGSSASPLFGGDVEDHDDSHQRPAAARPARSRRRRPSSGRRRSARRTPSRSSAAADAAAPGSPSRSRRAASRSRRGPSRSNRITRWSRASAGAIRSHQRSEQAKPCSSTIGGRVRRAVLAHLEVAARQVDDAPDVGVAGLGLPVRHDRVDRQQRRRAARAAPSSRTRRMARNAIRSAPDRRAGTARRTPRARRRAAFASERDQVVEAGRRDQLDQLRGVPVRARARVHSAVGHGRRCRAARPPAAPAARWRVRPGGVVGAAVHGRAQLLVGEARAGARRRPRARPTRTRSRSGRRCGGCTHLAVGGLDRRRS